MESRVNKRLVWWFLSIIWCAFIFYHSNIPAVQSEQNSMKVVNAVNSLISVFAGWERMLVSDYAVRKTAHFLEYFILGSLLFRALGAKIRNLREFMNPMGLGAAYAVSDEIHQFFVQGRAMRIFDVIVDSCGVLTGILLGLLTQRILAELIQREP